MFSFTRAAIRSCIAGTALTVTLLAGGASGATIDVCKLVLRPRCPYLQTPVCGQWKYTVRDGKTVRCCTKWGCIMKLKRVELSDRCRA
jgi:hypothetical protein